MIPRYTTADVYGELLLPYIPLLDDDLNLDEEEDDYAARMKSSAPNVPEEIAREWFYRHYEFLDPYSSLDFSTLRFELQTWNLERIPGREAFAEPKFCDDFSAAFEERRKNPDDWLARFMHQHGTWNTPPILLHNPDARWRGNICYPIGAPWHLLEGHRRLSFFQHLREQGRANAQHKVWVATKV